MFNLAKLRRPELTFQGITSDEEMIQGVIEVYVSIVELDEFWRKGKYSSSTWDHVSLPSIYAYMEDSGIQEWIEDIASEEFFGVPLYLADLNDDTIMEDFYELESEYSNNFYNDVYNIFEFYNMSFSLSEYSPSKFELVNFPLIEVW